MKFLIAFLYIVFTYYASVFSFSIQDGVFWGHKTNALFDLWTLQHVASGIIIAYILTKIPYFKLSPVWAILLLSLFWESLELILELGHLTGLDGMYRSGVEFWVNRGLIDPLAMLFGAHLFRLNKKVFSYAVMLTVVWLLVNLHARLTLPLETTLSVL